MNKSNQQSIRQYIKDKKVPDDIAMRKEVLKMIDKSLSTLKFTTSRPFVILFAVVILLQLGGATSKFIDLINGQNTIQELLFSLTAAAFLVTIHFYNKRNYSVYTDYRNRLANDE